jgi:hypothetical protein
MSVPHYATVISRFVLGGLIGVMALSTTMLDHVAGPVALLLPSLGFFVGGAVAGTALRRTIGTALGFGVAFTIGDVAGTLSLVATQAMTGEEQLLARYAFSYSTVFAIAGLIGLSSAAVRGRPLVVGVLGFSVGGFTTAALVVALLSANLLGGSSIRTVLAYAVPLTLPWVIGAVVVTEALSDEQRRNVGLH